MFIRQLNDKDAEKYLEIRLQALQTNPEAFASSYQEEKQYPLEVFQNRLKDDHSYTFGAFENEKLFGVVSLVKEQKIKIKHRATIYAMYVVPERRGNGIGKKLLAEAIKQAEKLNGIEQVHLSVVSNNESAKNLYRFLGFETYGIDKRALKIDDRYYDEELMVLYF
ncbi:N-acetyltransferase [Lentibacillus populi]|uniref:N-acetyltransferase n=1 Tax=Lentibacillus populi TaxID=1827502 RepID=A0A9W5TV82_9BACI|nr:MULTISPECIES: GNAT family N-acetyltransferase [Bacillaceae]MBT2214338.1 GNAT family N-acetyltransferase [Virgibacillus dakarensis]GGB34070.1 N-acetyltransferase [Lentibacillus populi]